MKYKVTDTTVIRPGIQIIWLDKEQKFEDFLKEKVVINHSTPINYHAQHLRSSITVDGEFPVPKDAEIEFV